MLQHQSICKTREFSFEIGKKELVLAIGERIRIVCHSIHYEEIDVIVEGEFLGVSYEKAIGQMCLHYYGKYVKAVSEDRPEDWEEEKSRKVYIDLIEEIMKSID